MDWRIDVASPAFLVLLCAQARSRPATAQLHDLFRGLCVGGPASGLMSRVPTTQARLALVLAYDGRPFRGWQSQATGDAVQDHLERAFAQITGQPVSVQGAGRTDAGVHARG